MATKDEAPARTRTAGIQGIEIRSIDWVPDTERHGKLWHQAPLWFLGNFQYFSIPIGFVGPAFGLSLGWTIVAGTVGILIGTTFMALHATQGPTLGLPQMIQSRAQFGYRGVIVALFAVLFTYLAFNVADQVLMSEGLNGTFGWNKNVIAIGHRDRRRTAGHLRARLGAPCLPRAAVHPAAPDDHHHDRRAHRPRRRRAQPGRLRVQLDGLHGAALSGGGVQHHVRGLRLGLLPLPATNTPRGKIIG